MLACQAKGQGFEPPTARRGCGGRGNRWRVLENKRVGAGARDRTVRCSPAKRMRGFPSSWFDSSRVRRKKPFPPEEGGGPVGFGKEEKKGKGKREKGKGKREKGKGEKG